MEGYFKNVKIFWTVAYSKYKEQILYKDKKWLKIKDLLNKTNLFLNKLKPKFYISCMSLFCENVSTFSISILICI